MTRFWINNKLQQELQARGVDMLSPSGWPGGYRWVGESISSENRRLEVWSTGVAVLKQPMTNYPDQGAYPYAAFPFTTEAEFLAKLDELGWGRIVTERP